MLPCNLPTFIILACTSIPAAAFLGWFTPNCHLQQKTISEWSLLQFRKQTRVNVFMSTCESGAKVKNESEVDGTLIDDTSSESFDEQYFEAYRQAIFDIFSKKNVLREFKKNEEDLEIIKELLLGNKRILPQLDIGHFLSKSSGDGESKISDANKSYDDDSDAFIKQKLQERRDMYLDRTGITVQQQKLATTLLSHLADHCAKTRQPKPLYIAWEKILEGGIAPLSRVLSTYLYVLGLDEDREESDRDIAAEVAMFHDAIYEPTEKTITLLVKSLVQRGDAAGAEALLDDIAVSNSHMYLATCFSC